jgi:hypothetical protein
MEPDITLEGLSRLTAKMPADTRCIVFYTARNKVQVLNPGVELCPIGMTDETGSHVQDNPTAHGETNV